MEADKLKVILELHAKWLNGDSGGTCAKLSSANLSHAKLSGANLFRAKLPGANLFRAKLPGAKLSRASLSRANLSRANLFCASLSRASLSRANLSRANLSRANLSGADLSGADLFGADLFGADLSGANLFGATLPKFQITPKGYPLYGFKKLECGNIATVLIPAEARRTASLIGRKCRAEYVVVVDGEGVSKRDGTTVYKKGETVYPNKYDPDIRVECTNGIHFFLTREEAEEY